MVQQSRTLWLFTRASGKYLGRQSISWRKYGWMPKAAMQYIINWMHLLRVSLSKIRFFLDPDFGSRSGSRLSIVKQQIIGYFVVLFTICPIFFNQHVSQACIHSTKSRSSSNPFVANLAQSICKFVRKCWVSITWAILAQ